MIFQKFLARSDQTKSGDISLAEFIHYVREHEKNLRLQFTDLDKNKDGKWFKIINLKMYIKKKKYVIPLNSLFTDVTYIFSGKIDLEELIKAFKDLGIEMERAEAKKLLQRFVKYF